MTQPTKLLRTLAQRGVYLRVQDGELLITPIQALTPLEAGLVQLHRRVIVDWLTIPSGLTPLRWARRLRKLGDAVAESNHSLAVERYLRASIILAEELYEPSEEEVEAFTDD